MPDYFKDLDVENKPMSKHKLVQTHEWSGRKVGRSRFLWTMILTVEPVLCELRASFGRRPSRRERCDSQRAQGPRIQGKVPMYDPVGAARRSDHLGQHFRAGMSTVTATYRLTSSTERQVGLTKASIRET